MKSPDDALWYVFGSRGPVCVIVSLLFTDSGFRLLDTVRMESILNRPWFRPGLFRVVPEGIAKSFSGI